MADIKYFVGGVSSHEGAWDQSANWSPVGVPTDTDLVIVDGKCSGQNIDEGCNQPGIDLGGFLVLASYTGQIATEANPLALEVSGSIILRGSGDVYFCNAGTSIAADSEVERLIIDVPSSTKIDLCGIANDVSNDSAYSLIQIISGQVNIRGKSSTEPTLPERDDAGTIIKELLLTPARTGLTNPFVTIGDDCVDHSNSDAKMNITITGGQLITQSSHDFIENMGGKVTSITV